jgi:hypothetical protein
VSASGTATGTVEHMLRQVTPGRYDAYEALLRALATPTAGQVWMLLWHGQAGSPDAQYGNMEVDGHGYAPCVTSAQELSASGWNRSYEVVDGVDVARTLYPDHYGLWLNPHAPGGGVGHRTPAVRSLRRAWVQPALGAPYLAIGLDVYDTSPSAVDSVRAMMQQSIGAVPEGLPVSTVAMSDEYDPVALWMRAGARPFYDREAHGAPAQAPAAGYGYPPARGAY